MTQSIEIFEVGPRDGLQNEKRLIPTAQKIALVDLLSRAGFARIEAASFVSPKWVPQMADGAEVMAGVARRPGLGLVALTPNLQGYERALAAGADEVAIFASASEAFSKANINATIAESLERFRPLAARAAADGLSLRGYVSCATDCPFEGPVAPSAVAPVVAALRDMGCHEVAVSDTLGRARPETIDAMLGAVLDELPPERLAGHYHDTGGRALENISASIARGLRIFDAAVGGLGGCPYAPGAAGNVATEAVLAHVEALGFTTGLDAGVVAEAAALARSLRSDG